MFLLAIAVGCDRPLRRAHSTGHAHRTGLRTTGALPCSIDEAVASAWCTRGREARGVDVASPRSVCSLGVVALRSASFTLQPTVQPIIAVQSGHASNRWKARTSSLIASTPSPAGSAGRTRCRGSAPTTATSRPPGRAGTGTCGVQRRCSADIADAGPRPSPTVAGASIQAGVHVHVRSCHPPFGVTESRSNDARRTRILSVLGLLCSRQLALMGLFAWGVPNARR